MGKVGFLIVLLVVGCGTGTGKQTPADACKAYVEWMYSCPNNGLIPMNTFDYERYCETQLCTECGTDPDACVAKFDSCRDCTSVGHSSIEGCRSSAIAPAGPPICERSDWTP